MRVTLGESWMPAPVSSNFSACSSTHTRNPRCASANAAVSPPIPAPATMILREGAMACARRGRSDRLGQGADRRPRRMRIEVHTMAVQSRAIGANDFVIIAHVEEHVRMIERRLRTDAHELTRADLDHGHA